MTHESGWRMAAAGTAGGSSQPLIWAIAAAAGAVLGAALKDEAKTFFTWIVKGIGAFFYERFAGSPLLRRQALKRYTKAVFEKYEFFVVPFVDNQRHLMRNVYVPLATELTGAPGGAVSDADAALREAPRSVVIGVPGAGKSMLLRHLIFAWADGQIEIRPPRRQLPWHRAQNTQNTQNPENKQPKRRLRVRVVRRRDIPVMVELHRIVKDDTKIFDEIVAQFKRDDFPNAHRFVLNALKHGRLTVLLDGLDEIASARRGAVEQEILDLAEEYRSCRVIVTCREAVYQGQLARQLPTTLRVADFDERLIRQFLRGWPGLDREGVVDQLIAVLHETPQLFQLARNPLLLTMIAYLYTNNAAGGDRTLPHTRAEFYKQVTDDLLEQRWHQTQQFQAVKKKALLLHLALLAHDSHGVAQDRVTLPRDTVVAEIAKKLPGLNLKDTDAEDVLDEIVVRSGLLLRIDGGERYQFAHLSLQEYHAAVALHGDSAGLLERHQRDPALWREVVRLWCGSVAHDSTDVITTIFERDPVLAFECLAEAQDVSVSLAETIIKYSEGALGDSPQLVSAFGLVASDPLQRGRKVFAFLADTLTAEHDSPRGVAAASALAATRLPSAVDVLLPFVESVPAAEQCLVSLGDIAVARLANTPGRAAVRMLGRIGTPAALSALVPFLFGGNVDAAVLAARYLGAGLADKQVEKALATVPLPPHVTAHAWTWVWEPFKTPDNRKVALIAGQITCLLYSTEELSTDDKNIPPLDPRIGIPLCTIPWSEQISHDPETATALLEVNFEDDLGIARVALATSGVSERRLRLLDALAPSLRLSIYRRLPLPEFAMIRQHHWVTIKERQYEFDESRHYQLIFGLVLSAWCCSAWAALSAGFNWHHWGPEWLAFISLADIVIAATLIGIFMRQEPPLAAPDFALIHGGPIGVPILLRDDLGRDSALLAALFIGFGPAVAYYFYGFLTTFVSSAIAILVLTALGVVITGVTLRGLYLQRADKNPLRGLLKA